MVRCQRLGASTSSEGAEKGEGIRRVPLAEKRQRREEQLARLSGVAMVGELDPSHALLDLANQMLETGSIVWLAPSKCSKRDDEVQMGLKDSKSTLATRCDSVLVSTRLRVTLLMRRASADACSLRLVLLGLWCTSVLRSGCYISNSERLI